MLIPWTEEEIFVPPRFCFRGFSRTQMIWMRRWLQWMAAATLRPQWRMQLIAISFLIAYPSKQRSEMVIQQNLQTWQFRFEKHLWNTLFETNKLPMKMFVFEKNPFLLGSGLFFKWALKCEFEALWYWNLYFSMFLTAEMIQTLTMIFPRVLGPRRIPSGNAERGKGRQRGRCRRVSQQTGAGLLVVFGDHIWIIWLMFQNSGDHHLRGEHALFHPFIHKVLTDAGFLPSKVVARCDRIMPNNDFEL